MGMAAVIYKKGAPDNFMWEEIKVGAPERGQVCLCSTAVDVNFADTYHRAGIPHPMRHSIHRKEYHVDHTPRN